ncbi:hypothetical protein [Chryseosolibacter indicus]|uniref:Terminase n=1 Tax=Chryseosolibacter indicus TaxID=2782351 RepID=A0ABS5VND1_9BACT|nr:hypothetical protein [Chryseosolibacter indicus]MBT1702948.1 hypothetical protein [Chryseosolibacter indicus]
MIQKTEKQALLDWEEFLEGIRNSTPVDINETEEEKAKRIAFLEKEGNEEEWFKYYFPKYSFAKPAKFHVESAKRFIYTKRIAQSRKWARGLSKSTRRMFEVFYLTFAKKFKTNMLLISKSEDNAVRLLSPYKGNLEANQRLINDYGVQEKPGSWSEYEFVTRGKCAFRAVGADQNPRGSRLDELRVTIIVFDDVDDDEVCRNPERVDQRFTWIQKAVLPTVDISGDYRIAFDNNVIAENCCTLRFAQYANDDETVNIRDEYGKSVWREKNSEADIDDMLRLLSYEAAQGEYFNNPISKGKVFTEMTYGKCPPMEDLPFVIIYADPSPSNKDKPSLKSKAKNSCKAVSIIGPLNLKYYLYKCFVDVTTNYTFIEWLYAARDYVVQQSKGKVQVYVYIENNTLQDPFYQQVLLPLIFEIGKERRDVLGVTPDDRDKPDKYFRIEGTLEPLNRLGQFIMNIEEKDDPHMKRMETQFLSVSPQSKTMDGPDSVEGGVHIAKNKVFITDEPGNGIMMVKRKTSSKRY